MGYDLSSFGRVTDDSQHQKTLGMRSENPRIDGELLGIATSLCVEATFWHFLGRPHKTARLIQQARDLLVARDRQIARDLATGVLTAHEDWQ